MRLFHIQCIVEFYDISSIQYIGKTENPWDFRCVHREYIPISYIYTIYVLCINYVEYKIGTNGSISGIDVDCGAIALLPAIKLRHFRIDNTVDRNFSYSDDH